MFFKSTLTVPKIKDLVNSPNQKYQNIYDTISNNTNSSNSSAGYTDIDLLPSDTTELTKMNSMKNELKSFLKKQLKEPVSDISTSPNSSSYSYSDY